MRHALVVIVVAAVLGCAGKRVAVPPEQLWESATKSHDDGAYEYAVEQYKKFLDQYPFDARAEQAELQIAYAYFETERYPEAIAAFSDFERMHPTSSELAAVEYHRGLAYEGQHRSYDRDNSAARSAYASFQNVVERFPGTPWAARAELRLRECRETLARHEAKVATFYLRRKSLRAAEARLRGLLADYPDTDATADVLYDFSEAYAERGETDGAGMALAALVQLRPESARAVEVRDRVRDTSWATSADPVGGLLAHLDRMSTESDRVAVPKAVSAYPDAPGAAPPR